VGSFAKDAPWLFGGVACLLIVFLIFGAVVFVTAGYAGLPGGKESSDSGSGASLSCDGTGPSGKNYKGGKFKEFVPLYQAAAKKYKLGPDGPDMLASVHEVETGFRGTAKGNNSNVGALGPMQFMPPTWRSYGVDANKDGKKDVHDPEDAIFGAANYLKASGAPNWQKAVLAYNHAGWYVNKVINGSKKFKIEECK